MQVSSESNFRPDTEGEGGHLFRLPCSVVLWGGGSTASTHLWRVWGALAVSGPHRVCPRSRRVPVYTAQAPGCSAGELSKADPGLHELPRPKPIRFRFRGTPQRRRLRWACVLCPSQVCGAQATRCLANAVSPGGRCVVSPPRTRPFSSRGVPCVSSGGLISGCNLPGRCQPSRILRTLG